MDEENTMPEVENNEEFEPLTFDEILEDPIYQAEFDRKVQKALTKAKTKWETNYSGVDNEEATKIMNENESLRQRNAILVKGVTNPEEIDFIQYTVGKKEGNFEENLDQYMEKYRAEHEPAKRVTTGFSQSNINRNLTEEEEYLNNKYAKNPYYKKK